MLKRIICENFMELEHMEYMFNDGKVPRARVQITGGLNAGRTRLLEAICFALGGVSRNGGLRPSHLISLSQKEARVSLDVGGKKRITRTIDKRLRKLTLEVCQSNFVIALTNEQFEPIIGLSPLAATCACVAGFYSWLPVPKLKRVFDEVFPMGVDLGPGFRIQRSFDCRVMCGEIPYEQASYQAQREFDLLLCYAIHKAVENDLGFVFADDVDEFKWSDALNPPEGVQLITTRYLERAPLEIR